MSRPSVDSSPMGTRRPLRVGALALAAVMLVTACATGAPLGGGLRAEPWTLESEAEDGSTPSSGEAWQSDLARSYGLHCERCSTPEDSSHRRLYSSIRYDITGSSTLTVRKWLSSQSYEAQRTFGLLAIKNVQSGIW
jgi:hypothetical protein